MINLFQLLILAVIQGACELLPVSSSAHVILAEKLMGIDPTTPAMTLLLVMLHTGTMLAVIVFFWKSWKANFFNSPQAFGETVKLIMAATIGTGVVVLFLKIFIDKIILKGASHLEIESLFGNLYLISGSLAAVGGLILWSGYMESRPSGLKSNLGLKAAWIIGLVQGICLPFRGFSRSGATISTGLILGIEKKRLEDFSFALAVILTPLVIGVECLRFLKAQHVLGHQTLSMVRLLAPSAIGMVLSFISGMLALKLLSRLLVAGRWYIFGYYCLFAAGVIFLLHCQGL